MRERRKKGRWMEGGRREDGAEGGEEEREGKPYNAAP